MFCEAATGRQLERVATRVSAGIVRPEFGKRKTADGIGTAPSQEGATLEALVEAAIWPMPTKLESSRL